MVQSVLTIFIKMALHLTNGVFWSEKGLAFFALYIIGAALVIAGVAVIVAAIVTVATRRPKKESPGGKEGRVKSAGIIMIGPIPIIFGTDKKSIKVVLILALALVIAVIIAMVLLYWIWR